MGTAAILDLHDKRIWHLPPLWLSVSRVVHQIWFKYVAAYNR